MHFWWTYFATIFAILYCKGLVIINDYDPGQCDQTNHGAQVLVLDRENREQVLICALNKGVYEWKTAGEDYPIGEIYSPGFDCSKILDSNPDAKDGLYYINLGGLNPIHVYCDMTTDGGGYILMGKMDSPTTWNVPSTNDPVKPNGVEHWASNLGEAPVLDFRVQMATADDFSNTVAHWSFRMKSERPLKNLMIDDQGCTQYKPGIGNIAYVKDILTEKIVTTGFRCSIFGGFHSTTPGFGWHQMNLCLNQPCSKGFAHFEFAPGTHVQVDHHGVFSYSASGNHSAVQHDATAFIGCSGTNQVCCGCFGPVGGTGDYCNDDCTEKNGGTVEKQTLYTWFWVRTSLPKSVWHRCMEYNIKNDNGDIVSYRLFDGNTTPEKGTCPKNGALLNEGIVVVPDGETGEKVPAIPGLLEYRKDNKKLYVRENDTWEVIAQEKKVSKVLKSDIAQLKMELKSNVSQLKTGLESDITHLKAGLKTNVTQLEKENAQLKNDVNVRLEDNILEMKKVIEDMNNTLNTLVNRHAKDPVFLESEILLNEHDYGRLMKWWIGGSFTLCWRATRDGWSSSTFHSNCDNKKPTVTLIRVGSYIFGGYATDSWEGNGYKSAPGSFIFSLRNKENLPPFKAPLKNQNDGSAIYTSNGYGPVFGGGWDMCLSDDAASNTNSHTYFNSDYQAPSGVSDVHSILAGTYTFTPSEVEVFHIV